MAVTRSAGKRWRTSLSLTSNRDSPPDSYSYSTQSNSHAERDGNGHAVRGFDGDPDQYRNTDSDGNTHPN